MSPYDLLAPAVTLAHTLLTAIAEAVPGPVSGPALALAVVVLTALVRAAMLPLAVRNLRAERARAALAPELARLRTRHAADRERLARELLAAHRAAGVGPLSGLGTALVQLPVVTTLYRTVLRRDPDPGGISTWGGLLTRDPSQVTGVQAMLYASPVGQLVRKHRIVSVTRHQAIEVGK